MDLKTGIGVEATLRYRLMERLSVYGGWDWSRFDVDEPLNGVERVEGDGFAYGVRFDQGILDNGSSVWLRGGGLTNRIRQETNDGTMLAETDYGAGWELGAGLGLRLGAGWVLTPGVRYRSLDRDLVVDGITREGELRFVTIGAGLQFGFR
jgi:hypothetical protein